MVGNRKGLKNMDNKFVINNEGQKKILGISDENIECERKDIDKDLRRVQLTLKDIIDNKDYFDSDLSNLLSDLEFIQEKVVRLNIHKNQAETWNVWLKGQKN